MARHPVMPTVGKRQLGRELRSLREASKFTLDRVAEELDWAKTKVHNLENGHWTRGNLTDLRALLDLYGVTDPQRRTALEDLMRNAKKRGWWVEDGDALDGALPAFEDEASQISSYEPAVIPGLVQTPEYTAALLRTYPFLTAGEVERRVEARMQRQRILDRDTPPEVSFVIEEAVVQRLVDTPVARAQIQHLIDVAEAANRVTLQVMPLRSGLHGALGPSFTLLDFAGDFDLSIVYTESAARSAYLEDKADVALYRTMFTHACGRALPPEKSIELLSGLLRQSS